MTRSPVCRVVREIGEAQRRLDVAGAMPPEPGEWVEAVGRKEAPAVRRNEIDRGHDVLEDGLGDEVVERDARPARLDPLAPAADDLPVLERALEPDAEQPVAIRAGTRASSARLDPEQVVEQRDDVVVVEVSPRRPVHDERHDRESVGVEVAEDPDVLVP